MAGDRCLFIIGDRRWNTASRGLGAEMAGWLVRWSAPAWTTGLPVWRRVPQYRLRNGPDVLRYNRCLVRDAVAVRPDVVWVEAPLFVYRDTLAEIKRRTGATLACAYSDDPRNPLMKSRHYDSAVSLYDIILVTKDDLRQRYLDLGCRCTAKFWKGFDPERIRPVSLSGEDLAEYTSAVAFIGHADIVRGRSMRRTPFEAVARAVPGTRIWGPGWGRVRWPAELPGVIHPYRLDGDRYPKAICATRVALQLPSRVNRDTHSSRSLEIPACRVLMLAERTVDHQLLFDEDREAVYFGSIAELVDKARYFTTHDGPRERIAHSGYERSQKSGYSNYERMKNMLALVDAIRCRS